MQKKTARELLDHYGHHNLLRAHAVLYDWFGPATATQILCEFVGTDGMEDESVEDFEEFLQDCFPREEPSPLVGNST